MEPMTLGSAPSSPSSPGINPNFLPAFLMGANQPSTPTSTISPERSRNYSHNLNTPGHGHLEKKLFSTPGPEPLPVLSPTPYDISVNKSGPPKQSLFDTIDTRKASGTPHFGGNLTQVMESPSVHHNSFSQSMAGDSLYNNSTSICRTSSHSNLETIKSDGNQNLWVTVFGFPTSSASLVLARFSNCGTIVEKRFPTQGNWVHIKFQSSLETAKALALNGKLISNCIMVGVVPHQTKQANKENLDSSLYTSPARVRSLRHSFVSPQNSNTVLPSQNVPQKSTGLVTKAMEYVFGW